MPDKIISYSNNDTGAVSTTGLYLDEGQTGTILWEDLQSSRTYYYSVETIDQGDIAMPIKGSTSSDESGNVKLEFKALADNRTEGDESFNIYLYDDQSYTSHLVSGRGYITDTSKDYKDPNDNKPVITGESKVGEGEGISLEFENLLFGTYYWRIEGSTASPHEDINTSDLISFNPYKVIGGISDTFTVDASSKNYKLRISPTSDKKTEGSEYFELQLFDNSEFSGTPVTYKKIEIEDTSIDTVPQLSWTIGHRNNYNRSIKDVNPSTINEGQELFFYLELNRYNDYYWKIDGIDKEDLTSATGLISKHDPSIDIEGEFKKRPYAEVNYKTVNDLLTEEAETITFTLSKDSAYTDIVLTNSISLLDTSKSPAPKVDIKPSNIEVNEGGSATIPLKIISLPSTTNIYWKLTGSGLSSDDLGTKFREFSERIEFADGDLKTVATNRGTTRLMGLYNLKIPFSADETTEGTEKLKLELYDNQDLSGTLLASTFITINDSSEALPKSTLSSAVLSNDKIELYFSEPIKSSDVNPNYFKLISNNKSLAIRSVNLTSSKNSAIINLNAETDVGSLVNIKYAPPNNTVLQAFEESTTAQDLSKPQIVGGLSFSRHIELRFSEKLKNTDPSSEQFKVKSNNKNKQISSIDLNSSDGIVIINLREPIDIDDEVTVSYYDSLGDKSSGFLQDNSGNTVSTFKKFQVTNNVCNAADFSVASAKVDGDFIVLKFDVDFDENSNPKNGMFRIYVNGKKGKAKDVQLNALRREVYLVPKKSVDEGDQVRLTYIDAKGKQRDNVIRSKCGGNLATFKDLFVENPSVASLDAPVLTAATYDSLANTIELDFDRIISAQKIKKTRFKIYTMSDVGKRKRLKISSVSNQDKNSLVKIALKDYMDMSNSKILFDYRDPKGDQNYGVIQDEQGNDFLGLKAYEVAA